MTLTVALPHIRLGSRLEKTALVLFVPFVPGCATFFVQLPQTSLMLRFRNRRSKKVGLLLSCEGEAGEIPLLFFFYIGCSSHSEGHRISPNGLCSCGGRECLHWNQIRDDWQRVWLHYYQSGQMQDNGSLKFVIWGLWRTVWQFGPVRSTYLCCATGARTFSSKAKE